MILVRRLVDFFLKYGSFNHLLFVVLLYLAYEAYQSIPKEMFPPAQPNTIAISGAYKEAGNKALNDIVVADYESILLQDPRLENVEASISNGRYKISADIVSGDKNLILNDVKNKIAAMDANLPSDMKAPSVEVPQRLFPLMFISVYGSGDKVQAAKALADEILKIPHIHTAELIGGYDETLKIVINEDKLRALGINESDFFKATGRALSNFPIGKIQTKDGVYFIQTKTDNLRQKDILRLRIFASGKAINLGDAAQIVRGYEKNSLLTRLNGEEALSVVVKKGESGDAIKLARQIKDLIKQHAQSLSGGKILGAGSSTSADADAGESKILSARSNASTEASANTDVEESKILSAGSSADGEADADASTNADRILGNRSSANTGVRENKILGAKSSTDDGGSSNTGSIASAGSNAGADESKILSTGSNGGAGAAATENANKILSAGSNAGAGGGATTNVRFEVTSDSSFWIKERLNTISSNIAFGLILLFFVIWYFVSFKIALVVIIGIPVSFAFGAIFVSAAGESINIFSMIGVLLSLGLLVDEAIVVSENIHRHKLLGKSLYQAALDGTAEVMPIVFVAMLTTVVAFLPLIGLDGSVGAFVRVIPIVVIALVAGSFIESFVFLPSHYHLLNRSAHFEAEQKKERIWLALSQHYKKLLALLTRHAKKFIAIFAASFALLTFASFKILNFQLFSEFDAMSINISAKTSLQNIDFTTSQAAKIEELLQKILPESEYSSIQTTIGMNTSNRRQHESGYDLFTITINLKQKLPEDFFNKYINNLFLVFNSAADKPERKKYAKALKQEILSALDGSGATKDLLELNIEIPQTGATKSDFFISFYGENMDAIRRALQDLRKTLEKIDGVEAIKDTMLLNNTLIELELNSYAQDLGLSQNLLIDALRTHLVSKSIYKMQGKSTVDLSYESLSKDDLQEMLRLGIKTPSGQTASLADLVIVKKTLAPAAIKKQDKNIIFSLYSGLDKTKITSGEIYAKIRTDLERIRASGVGVIIKGEQEKNSKMISGVKKSLIISALLIFLILTLFYNSFALSLITISVLPFSILGVLAGHIIMGLNLSLPSMLGLVGLMGVVVNDTLIMLSFIKQASSTKNLIDLAATRLRPIILTSLTTIAGLASLILFPFGESALMQPLAVSLGFGLAFATVINLFYIPVLFCKLSKFPVP
ncbi:MAG: efflux RND transporter permease subunit [Helicobacteraceae bacterium]